MCKQQRLTLIHSYIPIFLGGIMQACGNTPPIK
jgi:2-hydroxychromene-2-carboxylate isomerase